MQGARSKNGEKSSCTTITRKTGWHGAQKKAAASRYSLTRPSHAIDAKAMSKAMSSFDHAKCHAPVMQDACKVKVI